MSQENKDAKNKDVDQYSGVETTGHEWDGIKELNNPMPRWWIYTFIVCCIWGFAYQIYYPSWPLIDSYYEGVGGKTQREVFQSEFAMIVKDRSIFSEKIKDADLATINGDPSLIEFALAGGKAAFGDNCAPCHGTGAAGFIGYPNLNDDVWIWGGSLDEIHYTINYGIRGVHDDTRINDMPAFLRDELLNRQEIDELTTYVQSLSDNDLQSTPEAHEMFIDNCSSCHGEDGKGIREFGSPDLTDAISLYVTDRASIVDIISYSRGGVMPTWNGRLDEATIKSLAIYVHTLGGGE